jgi:hypothetical protein
MEGLVDALSALGVAQAGVVFLRGDFSRVAFMTGRPDTSGRRAATHAGPWTLDGPLILLGGSAIVGLDGDDRPLVHCHTFFSGPDGAVRGGHMLAGRCPLGDGGLLGLACCPIEAGFKIALDRETNFPIFHPLTHLSGAPPR